LTLFFWFLNVVRNPYIISAYKSLPEVAKPSMKRRTMREAFSFGTKDFKIFSFPYEPKQNFLLPNRKILAFYYVLSTIQSSLFASFRSKQKYCQNVCIRPNKVPIKLSLFMRCAKACKTLPFLQAFSYFPKTSPFSKEEEQPSSVITTDFQLFAV
jgi:hypothetical protein